MEKLIKTTARKLSGLEKAAILLSEIGPFYNSNYTELLNALKLTPGENKKIRNALKKLGPYAPGKYDYETGMNQIQREQSVLREALSYGVHKGLIDSSKQKTSASTVKNSSPGLSKLAGQNPKNIAKILKNWLDN